MKNILLKIGTLNQPNDRWLDALDIFSEVHIVCFTSEAELLHERMIYHKFQENRGINRFLCRILFQTNRIKNLNGISNFIIMLLRMANKEFVRSVKKVDYKYIHSSYNDFDESAFLTVLLGFKNNFTRAQKETRPQYSYLEQRCFKTAGLIVLNDRKNLEFFRKKYGNIFRGKKILYGLDEDVRKKGLYRYINHSPKYSMQDGRIHAVILAGRVLSDPDDARSGGRLYYIPLIRELLKAGIVVHLHTGKIVSCQERNPYQMLSEQFKDFMIEHSLDFANDARNAYAVLSRYDIGILHAHIPGTEVARFDRVNIPHRYYEYELAHVVPVERRGGNLLIEKKAREGHAVVCDSFADISLEKLKNIKWDVPDFDHYVKEIYRGRQNA